MYNKYDWLYTFIVFDFGRGKRMKDKLTCTDCEKKIKAFIDKKLDYRDTLGFVNHISSCEQCKEEFSIEFLVVNGLKKLDSAEAFDLQRELEDLVSSSVEWAKDRKRLYREIMLFAFFVAIIGGYFLASLLY